MNFGKIAMKFDTTRNEHILANGSWIEVDGHEYYKDSYLQHYKHIFDNVEQAMAQAQEINDYTRNITAIVVEFTDCFVIFQMYNWHKKSMGYRINGRMVYKADHEDALFYCNQCGSGSASGMCSLGHSDIREFKTTRHYFEVMMQENDNPMWLKHMIKNNNKNGHYDDLLARMEN